MKIILTRWKPYIEGFILGVLVTILFKYGWQYRNYFRYKDEFMLFNIGRTTVEDSLKGAKVMDVSISTNYREAVNYVYDRMYGVNVRYERNGIIKEITFAVSKYKGQWIGPNKTELFILDDKAKEVYRSKSIPKIPIKN